ncbi:MAG: HAMP domain-containing sensor histidine kinase [Candidatus Methylacidiphilales bacterium]|nr:HAMP domain-containing sensor histidine kinase [Candidatus Methylacidiphilales bacterium]
MFSLARITWWHSARRGLIYGLIFFIITAGYIILGDRLVETLARSQEEAAFYQTVKGLGFMAVASLCVGLVEGIGHYRRTRHQQLLLSTDRRSLAGVMASSVAHDINNMLTSALLEAEMLEGGMARPEAAGNIKKSLQEIARLVRGLRDFGKDQLAVQLVQQDLAEVVQEAVTITRKHPALKKARIETDLTSGLTGPCEKTLLQQLVVNLLLNAAETGDDVAIRVRLSRENGHALLMVEDNGPGIPEKVAARVFEPFYTTKSNGTGLGLTSVRAAVVLHHGRISQKKSELGGAGFRIQLPLATPTV